MPSITFTRRTERARPAKSLEILTAPKSSILIGPRRNQRRAKCKSSAISSPLSNAQNSECRARTCAARSRRREYSSPVRIYSGTVQHVASWINLMNRDVCMPRASRVYVHVQPLARRRRRRGARIMRELGRRAELASTRVNCVSTCVDERIAAVPRSRGFLISRSVARLPAVEEFEAVSG